MVQPANIQAPFSLRDALAILNTMQRGRQAAEIRRYRQQVSDERTKGEQLNLGLGVMENMRKQGMMAQGEVDALALGQAIQGGADEKWIPDDESGRMYARIGGFTWEESPDALTERKARATSTKALARMCETQAEQEEHEAAQIKQFGMTENQAKTRLYNTVNMLKGLDRPTLSAEAMNSMAVVLPAMGKTPEEITAYRKALTGEDEGQKDQRKDELRTLLNEDLDRLMDVMGKMQAAPVSKPSAAVVPDTKTPDLPAGLGKEPATEEEFNQGMMSLYQAAHAPGMNRDELESYVQYYVERWNIKHPNRPVNAENVRKYVFQGLE